MGPKKAVIGKAGNFDIFPQNTKFSQLSALSPSGTTSEATTTAVFTKVIRLELEVRRQSATRTRRSAVQNWVHPRRALVHVRRVGNDEAGQRKNKLLFDKMNLKTAQNSNIKLLPQNFPTYPLIIE